MSSSLVTISSGSTPPMTLSVTPFRAFELINHFFRPLVKWTYLGDYLIFGQVGVGYMATNLLIHFLNSLFLYMLLERRLLQPVAAAAAAAAFALSPLHSEAVLWAAGRPDTVLLTCWLGALLLLDRWCERPTAGRAVAFTGVALLGIGAKESWIVFPFLVVAYLALVLRLPLRVAVPPGGRDVGGVGCLYRRVPGHAGGYRGPVGDPLC